MSALWENQQSALAKTKAQISFAVTAKLISAFVFATRIVQFLLYLTPKFQASSSFLWLYRSVCVGPGRKPHCWFSHEAIHILISTTLVTWRDIQICSANNDTVISLDRSIVKQHYVISGFCLFMYVLVYYSYWLFLAAMISNVDSLVVLFFWGGGGRGGA